MKVMSRGLKNLLSSKKVIPFSTPNGFQPILHLALANDLIVITNGTQSSLHNLMKFFSDFEKSFRRKINQNKSCLIGSSKGIC